MKWKYIILITATVVIITLCQILMKLAAEQFSFTDLTKGWLLVVVALLYIAALAGLLISLKNLELSVAYSFLACSFATVPLVSFFVFNEPLGTLKIIGIFSVMLGVVFVGGSS